MVGIDGLEPSTPTLPARRTKHRGLYNLKKYGGYTWT